jgi:hypothetical protein
MRLSEQKWLKKRINAAVWRFDDRHRFATEQSMTTSTFAVDAHRQYLASGSSCGCAVPKTLLKKRGIAQLMRLTTARGALFRCVGITAILLLWKTNHFSCCE